MNIVARSFALPLTIALFVALSVVAQAAKPGTAAPEISGKDLVSGRELSLSDLRGKWVFVDFWASWCGPCMKQLPSVVGLQNDLGSDPNFTVLGVSLDSPDTMKALKKAVKKNNVNYPVLYCNDGCNMVASAWGVQTIPATFLIDPQGRIVGQEISVRQVRELIEQGGSSYNDSRYAEPKSGKGGTVPARQPKLSADYSVRPVQVKCREQLLAAQSGMPGAHDLEITMDLRSKQPRVSNYRMFLRATKRTRDGRSVDANWRYDINVLYDPSNSREPYFIEIKDSSAAGKTLGYDAPDIAAALDPGSGACRFLVPLAPDTLKLNYAVALYEQSR